MAQKYPRPPVILWDLDGTLIDQTTAILRCYADVVENLGLPRPDAQTIRRSMGGPMRETMALFVPHDQLDEAGRAFRARFPNIMFEGLIALPGGASFLERAHAAGTQQAIFTNKHGDTARRVSQHLGFDRWAPLCIGSGDTEWHKPDPCLTRHVLAQLGVPASGAVVIGDSPTDVAVAEQAGLAAFAVATGAHSIAELEAAGARAAYPDLPALEAAFDWA
jgi:phosphoglycolate phosphatase